MEILLTSFTRQPQTRFSKWLLVAGGAAAVAVAGGLLLGIRLRFHNQPPQQLAIRLALHQQAADELRRNLLGGAGEEGLGECWEGLGDGLGGYGCGLGNEKQLNYAYLSNIYSMISLTLSLLAPLTLAANAALAQGRAGSYGQVTNQCFYYINSSLLYKFDCRVMYSGEVKPSRIFFIDNYKSNERYLVGRGQPIINSEIYGFKYVGGRCIANTDTNVKICW